MALTTGSTSPTAQNILKTRYVDMVHKILPNKFPILGLMRRFGPEIATKNKTIKFGLQTTRLGGFRYYNEDDPATYARRDGGLDFVAPEVTFKKGYLVFQLSREVGLEAGAEGALTDAAKRTLADVPDTIGLEMERAFLTQKGDGALFAVKNSETAGASVTVEVENLGGFSGQEIGHVLRNLQLRKQYVQFSTGALPSAFRSATASQVSSYVDTLGSESLTFGTLSGNLTAGDLVVLSRDDLASGSYAATTWPTGLPGLVDDYTRLTTFQAMTSSTAPEFKSTVLSNGGTKRALNEDLLSNLVVACRVRSAKNIGEDGYAKWTFICSETQKELFAQTFRSDRRFGAPATLTVKGVKPYAGVEAEALHFNGIPFFCSPMAQRNSIYLLDTEDAHIVHNGPTFGQWMVQGHDIETGPLKQWVWEMHNNFAMDIRNSSGRIDDLTTMTGI